MISNCPFPLLMAIELAALFTVSSLASFSPSLKICSIVLSAKS